MTTLNAGIKADELRPCALCQKGLAHDGALAFYRLTVEQFVVNLPAVRRQHGLEQLIGNAMLAHVMGPQEDMAKRLADPTPLLICLRCATERHLSEILEVRAGDS